MKTNEIQTEAFKQFMDLPFRYFPCEDTKAIIVEGESGIKMAELKHLAQILGIDLKLFATHTNGAMVYKVDCFDLFKLKQRFGVSSR